MLYRITYLLQINNHFEIYRSAGKKKKEAEPPPPPPEPEPVAKPPEVRKPLKGPKCWVDDATISDESEKLDNDLVDKPDGVNTRPQSAVKTVTIQEKHNTVTNANKPLSRMSSKANIKAEESATLIKQDSNVNQETVRGILSAPKPEEEAQEEIELQSVISESIAFPRYICPSSYRKSKNNAIKHWLHSTNFNCAEKNVPLL